MNTFREVFGEYNNDGYCCPGCLTSFGVMALENFVVI